MTIRRKKIVIAITAGLLLVIALVGVAQLARITLIAVGGLLLLSVAIFVVYRIWANRKIKTVFAFYVAANDVLMNGDGDRYHFEVADVIKRGERVIRLMPDAPALSRFALGALYHSINEHSGAIEHLALAAEEEVLKDSSLVMPSRTLRRYVKRLRRIQRRPLRYAKINAAIASLEVMQRDRGARMLAQSQNQLKRIVEAYEEQMSEEVRTPRHFPVSIRPSLKSITGPSTISEVLNDIYQEES